MGQGRGWGCGLRGAGYGGWAERCEVWSVGCEQGVVFVFV